MKRIIYLLVLFVVFSFGCEKKSELSGISQIVVTDNADVKLLKGDKFEIISDDSKDSDDSLVYTVDNGVLTVLGNSDAVVYVRDFTVIATLTVNENADVDADDTTFNFDNLVINVAGEGDISAKLAGNNLVVNLTDEADLDIVGDQCSQVSLTADANADYNASNFIVNDYVVNLSGNSDAHINATNSITGQLAGYADLYYKGLDSSMVNLTVQDSAQIHYEGN